MVFIMCIGGEEAMLKGLAVGSNQYCQANKTN